MGEALARHGDHRPPTGAGHRPLRPSRNSAAFDALLDGMTEASSRGVSCALLLGGIPGPHDAEQLRSLPFAVRGWILRDPPLGHAKGMVADGVSAGLLRELERRRTRRQLGGRAACRSRRRGRLLRSCVVSRLGDRADHPGLTPRSPGYSVRMPDVEPPAPAADPEPASTRTGVVDAAGGPTPGQRGLPLAAGPACRGPAAVGRGAGGSGERGRAGRAGHPA